MTDENDDHDDELLRLKWLVIPKRDLAELRELGGALLNHSWLSMDSKERLQLLRRFAEGYWLPPSEWHPFATYRAQENADRTPFPKVSRLLAPPPDCVKELGRLNRIGKPTLYIAATPYAAIKEIDVGNGGVASVLAARLRPGAPGVALIPAAMSAHQGSLRIGSYAPDFADGALSFEPFATRLKELGCLEQWTFQEEVLSHLLTLRLSKAEEQKLYEMTNELRDGLYASSPAYEGVEYPSAVEPTAPNIALDKARWQDIEPLEVWVVEVGPDIFETPTKMMIGTKPLLWFGTVGEDGTISYSRTDKTLLSATADFKQKYGIGARTAAGQYILPRPYTRHRIAYGTTPGRKRMDFAPAGSGYLYWTP